MGQAATARPSPQSPAANDVHARVTETQIDSGIRDDQAVEQTRMVLESATAARIHRAEALEQMGLLASLGSKEVQQRSTSLHKKAIELADQLAASDEPAVRIAATQLLIGAHLAMAESIAAGDWKDKDEFVAQWISRASALSEQLI